MILGHGLANFGIILSLVLMVGTSAIVLLEQKKAKGKKQKDKETVEYTADTKPGEKKGVLTSLP